MLFFKFRIEIPGFSQCSVAHLPSLFTAMQFHTRCIFVNKPTYRFGYGDGASKPISNEDFIDYLHSEKNYNVTFHGDLHKANEFGECFMLAGCYTEAIRIFRMRLSGLSISNPDGRCSQLAALTDSLVYKILLCKYLDGQYEDAIAGLIKAIGSDTNYSVRVARMKSLLMAAYFKRGQIAAATQAYEEARLGYTFELGTEHPVHAIHYAALGDLYFSVKAYANAKVMLLLAQEHSSRVLGSHHILTAGYSFKLAVISTKQGEFDAACDLYSYALNTYDETWSRGATSFQCNVEEALLGLSTSLVKAGKLSKAVEYLDRLFSITERPTTVPTTSSDAIGGTSKRVAMSFSNIQGHLLLADVNMEKGESTEALAIYEKVWKDLKVSSDSSGDAKLGELLAQVTSKILLSLMNALPLQMRSLLYALQEEYLTGESRSSGAHGGVSRYKHHELSGNARNIEGFDAPSMVAGMAITFKFFFKNFPTHLIQLPRLNH